jgi:hypothetical protein
VRAVLVVVAGWVALVAAVTVELGMWALAIAGVVTVAVGVFADLDPDGRGANGKHRKPSPPS